MQEKEALEFDDILLESEVSDVQDIGLMWHYNTHNRDFVFIPDPLDTFCEITIFPFRNENKLYQKMIENQNLVPTETQCFGYTWKGFYTD